MVSAPRKVMIRARDFSKGGRGGSGRVGRKTHLRMAPPVVAAVVMMGLDFVTLRCSEWGLWMNGGVMAGVQEVLRRRRAV